MRFEESLAVGGRAKEVWDRASSIEDIPKYWHGTSSLRVVEERQGGARVRVKFAFGGSGEADISKDEARRTMEIDYLSGPFKGSQTVTVDDDKIVAGWDVNFSGVYRLASRWNRGHFRSGTVHALERLVGGRDGEPEGR